MPPDFAFFHLEEAATAAGKRDEDDGADEIQTNSTRHNAKNEMDSVNDEERIARGAAFGSHPATPEDFMVKAELMPQRAARIDEKT